MTLRSADFESAASASNLRYISKIIISLWKMCKKVCKFRPAFCKTRLQPDRSILADLCIELEGGVDGGRGRSRTDMRLPSADFESAVAANFTTRP